MKTLKRMFGFIDLTKGSPLKVLLMFLLPLFITTLLTNSLNVVNTLILKVTVGGDSVTAINQTNALNAILLNFAIGACSGFAVIGGQFFGKKDEENTKNAFHNSIVLVLIIGVILTLIGVLILTPTLTLLNVDQLYFKKAHDYYILIIIGLTIIILNQLMIAYLRVMGNSFFPLIISVTSALIQMLLVFLLTSRQLANLDTIGCGIATIMTNGVALIANYTYLIKKYPKLRFNLSSYRYNKVMANDLLKQGLPLGFQWSILFIGSFVLTRQINLFGPNAGHGMTVYSNMEGYSGIFFSTIATSLLSFVSQNYGANQFERIKEGVKWALILDIGAYILVFIVGYILIPYAPSIFLNQEVINEEIRFYASTYLYILYPAIIFQSLLTLSRSTLQGIKKPLIPFLSGIGELAMRLLTSLLLPYIVDPNYVTTRSRSAYIALSFSNASAWLISTLIMGISVVVILRSYRKEKKPNRMNSTIELEAVIQKD